MKAQPAAKIPGAGGTVPIQNGNGKSGGITNAARGKYGKNIAKAMKQKGK